MRMRTKKENKMENIYELRRGFYEAVFDFARILAPHL